jgi:hypothetical protein
MLIMDKIGVFLLMMVVCSGFVVAAATPDYTGTSPNVDATTAAHVAEANRYLSAETIQQLQAMQKQISADLQKNQDADAQALDDRMKAYTQRELQMVLMGSIGATLVASAGVALFMFRVARKNAYEAFIMAQNDQFRLGKVQGGSPEQSWIQPPNTTTLQKENTPQETFKTISMEQGQSYASNSSKLSNWQVQGPYHDGWSWPQDGDDGGWRS